MSGEIGTLSSVVPGAVAMIAPACLLLAFFAHSHIKVLMMPAADFTLNGVSGKSHDGGNVGAATKSKVGRVGVEPTRPFGQGILRKLSRMWSSVLTEEY